MICVIGWRRRVLDAIGAHALTLPWGNVWIAPEHDSDLLRKHEAVHLDQIAKDSPLLFSLRYLVWYVRFGYWWHPYEVVARVVSGEDELKEHYTTDPVLGPLLKRHMDG